MTTTPWLPDGEVPPQGVRVVERNRTPMPTTFVLPPDTTLADRAAFLRTDALCRPIPVPSDPFPLSASAIADFVAWYDRLSGGQFAAHRDAVWGDAVWTEAVRAGDAPPDMSRYPLAWALAQLGDGADQPGWSCMANDRNVVATAQVGAFRAFLFAWSRHPLFPAMAAGVAAAGFSTHALAVFAAAQCLADSGNRIGFTRPPVAGAPFDGFHVETSATERTPVVVRRFDRFDWPRLNSLGERGVEPAMVRMLATDALSASQARLTVRQPGLLVLSVGAVRAQDDFVIIDNIGAVLRARGRRLRGLTGVAVIMPKLRPGPVPDQAGFGWTFLPLVNAHVPGAAMRGAAASAVG